MVVYGLHNWHLPVLFWAEWCEGVDYFATSSIIAANVSTMGNMKKFLKYSLWSAGVVVAIAIAGVVYIAATFNPNDYKTQIIKLVKDKQQRTLKLDGNINWFSSQHRRADIARYHCLNFRTTKNLCTLTVRVSRWRYCRYYPVKWLWTKFRSVAWRRLWWNSRTGKTNIDDLLSKKETDEEKKPLEFDIASVRAGRLRADLPGWNHGCAICAERLQP